MTRHFSFKIMFPSCGIILALYSLLAIYVFSVQTRTLKSLESRLAHKSASIEKPAPPPELDMQSLLKRSSNIGLPPAPISGLTENFEDTLLPIVSASGQTPFNSYKKPHLLNHNKRSLAVAVLNYGLSTDLSDKMLADLPSPVTFIVNPYATDPALWQKKARENGHETWMQLMTITNDFPRTDPGAKGLLTSMSLKYNQERLYWTMGRATGYAGLAAFTDTAMNNAAPMFQTLAKDIFHRGLGYFELNPAPLTFFEPLAQDAKAPHAHGAFFLSALADGHPDLARIEQYMKDHGGALVTITPTPANISYLKLWLADLQEQGVDLVPVSAFAALSIAE